MNQRTNAAHAKQARRGREAVGKLRQFVNGRRKEKKITRVFERYVYEEIFRRNIAKKAIVTNERSIDQTPCHVAEGNESAAQ